MLQVSIKNMSFEYGLRYEVDTTPDLFDDRGTGRLAVENMTLVIRFGVVPRNGRAQFEVNQTSVEVENYHAEFKGTHELADGVTIVLDAFKPVFKKEILSMATRKISKMLQHQINTLLFNQPPLIPITNEPPISLNYTMT